MNNIFHKPCDVCHEVKEDVKIHNGHVVCKECIRESHELFNFEKELKKLDEAHKAYKKARNKLQTQAGLCFDLFLKQIHMTSEEFFELDEEKQDKIYADYEQRKWH